MGSPQAIPDSPGSPGSGGNGSNPAEPPPRRTKEHDRHEASAPAGSAERVARLRGAGVDVDRRRLAQVVVVVLLLALVGASIALFAVGAHRNRQIDALRQSGRPVEARVTSCLGLLGGSGSNAAGYTCRAAYTVDGRRYVQTVPGNVLRSPGSRVAIVVAATDPTLIDTPGMLAGEHASWRVFMVPSVLALVFLGGLVLAVRGWRKGRPEAATHREDAARGDAGG